MVTVTIFTGFSEIPLIVETFCPNLRTAENGHFFSGILVQKLVQAQDIVNIGYRGRFRADVTSVTPATPMCNTKCHKIKKCPKWSKTGWNRLVIISIASLPTLVHIGPLEWSQ